MSAPDKVTEYMISLYLAAGGSVNNVRKWKKEYQQSQPKCTVDAGPCAEDAACRMVAIASRNKWQWEDFWHECTAYGLACQEYGRKLERGEVRKPKARTPEEIMAELQDHINRIDVK